MDAIELDGNVVTFGDETLLLDHSTGLLISIDLQLANILTEIDFTLSEERLAGIMNRYSVDALRRALDQIDSFLRSGFLVKRPSKTKSLSSIRLHITNKCNLRCSYCFQNKSLKDMALETAKKAIDFLLYRSASDEVKIVLFGGEPLMVPSLIRDVLEYGQAASARQRKRLRYALSTNATLFTHKILTLLREWDIGVLASYDGETHDAFRKTMEGAPCHVLVKRNIRRAVMLLDPTRLAVAATVHHYNTDIPAILRSIIDLGVKNIKLTFEHSWGSPYGLTITDCQTLAEQTPMVLDLCEAHADVQIQWYLLEVSPDGAFRHCQHCEACTGELTVDVEGNIYPCSFFVGDYRFRLGNVVNGESDVALRKRFAAALDRTRNGCSSCDIRRLCGGHCPYESYLRNGTLETPNPEKCIIAKRIAKEKIRRYYLSVRVP
jgi:uncharacterized protein